MLRHESLPYLRVRLCRHPGDHKPMVIVDLKPGVSSNMVEYVRILEERDP